MQISKNSMSVMKKLVRVKRKLITPKNKLQVIMEAAPHHIPVVAEAPVLVAVTVVVTQEVDGLIQESTIRIKAAAATVVVKNRQEVTAIRCQRRWFVLNQANLLRGPSSIISTTRAVD